MGDPGVEKQIVVPSSGLQLTALTPAWPGAAPVLSLTAPTQSNAVPEKVTVPEPIAIIGIGCRFPGGASNPQELWANLAAGHSAWSKGVGSRYDLEAFQDPENPAATTTNAGGGHFLSEDIAAFDAPFFGINPLEAKAMDPQQRLLLEIAYEAFENASLTSEALWSSNTGVYVGQWTCDYAENLSRDPEFPATYQTTGAGPAITSNRISYHFNLNGPSLTVDTGCSASLVALHLAVQSLRSGETELSFVGGVNILSDPQRFLYQSKLQMFSDEGKSFCFDHRANGYGRGEGVSGVVLKPLSAALRDKNTIRGVVRNSVINQDGRTSGITVPNGAAQERAIRKAYADVGLSPSADYVEAHGTGTAVGDPIEVHAIASVLAEGRTYDHRLPIGSIKGNIGHTESTAGLAGLIKAVLMLEQNAIPPQVNFEKPNKRVLLDEWNLYVPVALEHRDLRRISLNSFGYGGTNAHVILEAASEHRPVGSASPLTEIPSGQTARPRVFLISGASEGSCQSMAAKLADYVSQSVEATSNPLWLDRLAHTLMRRTLHKFHLPIVVSSSAALVENLKAAQLKPLSPRVARENIRLGFVFGGQGAQYYNMGRELIDLWPSFTDSLKRASRQLVMLGSDWDLIHELQRSPEKSRVDDPALGQPTSTAIQMGIIDSLSALGVVAEVVVGHSSGEIAAAYSAGLLSFEDAMTVSYHRGRLTSEMLTRRDLSISGAMLAVGAGATTVETYIADTSLDVAGKLTIACYNSPASVTVSGDRDAIQRMSQRLEADSVFNRVLRTNGAAYHSPQMQHIAEEYAAELQGLEVPSTSSLARMISSVTGTVLQADDMCPQYWVRNLLSPVRFDQALREATNGTVNVNMLVEIGPHVTLEGPVKQCLQALPPGRAQTIQYVSTLRRKKNAAEELLGTLAALHCAGLALNLQSVNAGFVENVALAPLTDLPPYAFDHQQTYWHESRLSRAFRHPLFPPHELLGSLSPEANSVEPRWRRYMTLKDVPWLEGHVVQGQFVFPAAGYLAMAGEALRRHRIAGGQGEPAGFEFRNVSFGKALVLSKEMPADHEICVSMQPEVRTARQSSERWMDFRIFTVAGDRGWTEHCRGIITDTSKELDASDITFPAKLPFSARAEQQAPLQRVSPLKFYHLCRDVGLEWTQPFDNVSSLNVGKDTCVYTVTVPDGVKSSSNKARTNYWMHPGLLDTSLFHGLCAVLLLEQGNQSAFVPTFIEHLIATSKSYDSNARNEAGLICTAMRTGGPQTFDVVMEAANADGRGPIVARAHGISTTRLPADLRPLALARELCHSPYWVSYCESITPTDLRKLAKTASATISGAPKSIALLNDRLNAATLMHVGRALAEVPGEAVPEGYRRQYYEWMKLIQCQAGEWDTLKDVYNTTIKLDEGVVDNAVAAIGANLPGILRCEVEPLAVLSENNVLSRIYSDERCQRCYAQISAYCVELARQNSNLKVLEIGAGTGAAAEPLLQALFHDGGCPIAQYDFTDISPAFVDAGRARLAPYAEVTQFHVLDIEQSPSDQGFVEGSYDVILACNVIHATSSINNSLKNVRSLLRSGGVFILMEITEDMPFYNMIFGSLPGWWAGIEDGRAWSPIVDTEQWALQLEAAGFQPPLEGLQDYPKADGGTISILISRTPTSAPSEHVLSMEVVQCLGAEKQLPRLVECLSTRLSSCRVASADLYTMPSSLDITIFPPEICEALVGSGSSTAAWENFKKWMLLSKAVLLLTRGATIDCQNPLGGAIAGFANTFRRERPDIRLITLDLSQEADGDACADAIAEVLQSPSFDLSKDAGDSESEFAERDGRLFVLRMYPEPNLDRYARNVMGVSEPEVGSFVRTDRTLTAQLGVPGVLDSLRWVEDQTSRLPLAPNEIELDLRAASINFKDVLIASGQLEGVTEMRNDCSGIVINVGDAMKDRFKPGDRVCCYYSRSYTNRPRVHGDCCAVIPETLGFKEAASLPIVWGTVYHALVSKANLQKGESILIHSAAGAVGQAAIALAHHLGAEVFATVGNAVKREFLSKRCGVRAERIFSSRTTDFGQKIRDMTPNGGVDVVLNSLGGDMFRETCNTLAHCGRFIEIGRKEFLDDMLIPSRFLLANITFAYVDLALLIDEAKPVVRVLLETVVKLMASGAVQPTSIITMPISDITSAFRMIQAAKHVGKIILTVEEEQQVKMVPPSPPPAQLRVDGAYLIIGGTGGLGKSIIRWLAGHGARRIVTVSRSAKVDAEAQFLMEKLRGQGVSLVTIKCDISSLEDIKATVKAIQDDSTIGPLRGVIHSAMVIQDSSFENMNYSQWINTLRPKVAGVWNLHVALPNELDFFIMLSSTVAISGNPGQCHYGAGCAFKDAVARYRRGLGLPAYSINIGAVSGVGYVSENPEVAAALRRNGLGTITEAELLAHLQSAITNEDPKLSNSSVGMVPAGDELGLRESAWLRDSKFRHVARHHTQCGEGASGSGGDSLSAISAARTADEALELVVQALLQQLSKLIMTPEDRLSDQASLDNYGVDSLVAVELKNWMSAYLQCNIPMMAIRGSPSIRELGRLVTKSSRLVQVEV